MSNRLFYYGITLSLLIHAAAIFSLKSHRSLAFKKPPQSLEVTYKEVKQKMSKATEDALREFMFEKEIKQQKKIDIVDKKEYLEGSFGKTIKDLTQLKGRFKGSEKRIPKINTLDMKRSITIPVIDSDKITNPRYLSYKDRIRSKIIQTFHTFYADKMSYEEGEVYVAFILDKQGRLKGAHPVDTKTDASRSLREIALSSIKDAAPFPNLPTELNVEELPFSITISFHLTE